jgi:hypothetical protein
VSRDIKNPPANPLRAATFRELARNIVLKDRWERKAGRTVDTAGTIARAMEGAYRVGFKDALSGEVPWPYKEMPEGEAIEWVTIPPRPRKAFHGLCYSALRNCTGPEHVAYFAPSVTERGTPGWHLMPSHPTRRTELEWAKGTVAQKTMNVLLKLGLIEPLSGNATRLVVTRRGRATWRRFCDQGGPMRDDLTTF